MSGFASNLAFLARSKLRSSVANGSRGEVSLHRWVLLKNSLIHDDSRTSPDSNASIVPDIPEVEAEDEEVDVDLDIDEDVFAFLFPDPGDDLKSEGNANASEAQWLDSLLETLGDDDDEDIDIPGKGSMSALENEDQSQTVSTSSSFAEDPATPPGVSYAVSYPSDLFHPPVSSCNPDSQQHLYFFTGANGVYSPFDDIDDGYLSMPDAIEDTSDDESMDSPSTPFTRSRSSLNLVDPASVPLPRERPSSGIEPHIYDAAEDFYPFDADPLPYPDVYAESPASFPVYGPFYQSC